MNETKPLTLVETLRAELAERREQLHHAPMSEKEREWLRDLISWLEEQIRASDDDQQKAGIKA